MAVLNTTSPTVWPSAPMPQPRKTLPSARTRTAGFFCDTGSAPGIRREKAGERNGLNLGLIPLSLTRNYSRAARLSPLRLHSAAMAADILHALAGVALLVLLSWALSEGRR